MRKKRAWWHWGAVLLPVALILALGGLLWELWLPLPETGRVTRPLPEPGTKLSRQARMATPEEVDALAVESADWRDLKSAEEEMSRSGGRYGYTLWNLVVKRDLYTKSLVLAELEIVQIGDVIDTDKGGPGLYALANCRVVSVLARREEDLRRGDSIRVLFQASSRVPVGTKPVLSAGERYVIALDRYKLNWTGPGGIVGTEQAEYYGVSDALIVMRSFPLRVDTAQLAVYFDPEADPAQEGYEGWSKKKLGAYFQGQYDRYPYYYTQEYVQDLR